VGTAACLSLLHAGEHVVDDDDPDHAEPHRDRAKDRTGNGQTLAPTFGASRTTSTQVPIYVPVLSIAMQYSVVRLWRRLGRQSGTGRASRER
jgi:hypothetical protein